jgi:tetratricopeptide (TPR) repeat protein/DNA-binding winged helix-turn-helix (wHTH) protein
MKVLGKQVYRFGEIELDVSQGCIKLNGQDQYLRQKALLVLRYLLEHRTRLVTKEELIENIWEGAAVTDDALVQLIKEVRRGIGDDPRRPRFIKTVPKAGYRFIGPVEEVIAGGPAIVETREITTVELDYEEEDDAQTRRLKWPPSFFTLFPRRVTASSRLRVVLFALLAATLAAAIAVAIYLRPVKRSLPDVALPQVAGKMTVAVMHFDNLSASPELDWLREGLADMLITDLSRSAKLTVLGRQQLHLLLERLEQARDSEMKLEHALQIAQASRAEHIVLGSFAIVGESIHISVQLYDARGHQPLASERIVADKPEDIIAQMDLLSLKLASHLGAKGEGQEAKRGLTEAMTDNLEAYRCYSLAVEKSYGLQNAEAIALLERAVSLDPQFAMAYARIGYGYIRWGLTEEARLYLEKAFRLSDRLSEKERLYIAAWYSMACIDYPGAIRYFHDIVTRYPLEVEAYWRLASLLQVEERLEEALDAAKRGLAVDAEAKELYNQMGGIYLDLHRPDEAMAMYQRYVALAPGEPNAYDSLGLGYQGVGRYGEAVQSYERALALKPDFGVALIHLANACLQQGRYREAISHYQRYIQVMPAGPERERGYGGLCEVYLRMGQLDRAEEAANREVKRGTLPSWRHLVLALKRGEWAKVDKLKEELFAGPPLSNRGSGGHLRFYYYHRGYLRLKEGRAAEAIEDFKEALKHRPPYWDTDTFEDCLANAYLELGQLDEAIAEYERVLSINPNYPLAHYHLAQAYERKGEGERARAEYERFLQTWQSADQDIPEIKTATRISAKAS